MTADIVVNYILGFFFIVYGWLLMPLYLLLTVKKEYSLARECKTKSMDAYLAAIARNKKRYWIGVVLFAAWVLFMGILLIIRMVN